MSDIVAQHEAYLAEEPLAPSLAIIIGGMEAVLQKKYGPTIDVTKAVYRRMAGDEAALCLLGMICKQHEMMMKLLDTVPGVADVPEFYDVFEMGHAVHNVAIQGYDIVVD